MSDWWDPVPDAKPRSFTLAEINSAIEEVWDGRETSLWVTVPAEEWVARMWLMGDLLICLKRVLRALRRRNDRDV